MDFPVTFHIFGKEVLLHPITESLGIFVGMRYYTFLKRKDEEKFSSVNSLLILIAATFGALIGSHVIGSLERPDDLMKAPDIWMYIWLNNTIVGGLAGGLIGVEVMKKIIGKKESTGDRMVYPLILAMFIGRIGCFFTGVYEETYGLPTNSIFGMDLGDHMKRHPVALYEMIFLAILFLALKYFQKNYTYKSGVLFQGFMLFYFSFRFFLDFIKPKYNVVFNLSTIQIVCFLMIIYYIYLLKKNKHEIIRSR
ncbi:diacylglyceryl transferase [Chryseobacterium joostei]|mgnify:CR=1 FL=1|uniref:Diacylglyceryl transferase n=1 Tax=Chryseobacterium joostei TaxID=112234 RepID=A0A1N7I7K9_9FLAO|nr:MULTISPECIES: prolipoprotein diacylglyceryl transferase family protein [Chryseobacterium]AZB00792.1 diacylglyceryl transferase [Chryseobacterium joostei]SIS33064.1 Prolipoprotein diacylglyceryltransferase [Chryseobacterium joostei]HCM34917.1 diacylglyceryl transferase [Chryseobacterium sp.]